MTPATLHAGFRPPRPTRGAALLMGPVSLAAALWATGVLPTAAALGFGASFVVLATAQGAFGAYDLHRSRRLADALLRAYPGLPPVSALAAWRSAELTTPRARRELAVRVRLLRRETETCISLGVPDIDGAVLDEAVVLLRRLQERLAALPEPVSPLGMLEVRALVTGHVGPLNFPEHAGGLPAAVAQALAALERT